MENARDGSQQLGVSLFKTMLHGAELFQGLVERICQKTQIFIPAGKCNRFIKYGILLVFVILLPILMTNQLGMGDPFFGKYLCPQGVLEGALPLSIANAGIRAALGKLFTWKAGILVAVVLLSLMFYRPFCKWICPLGAVYALFNKVSLLQMHIDTGKCVSCGKCAGVCKMDVDVVRHPNHTECIRCGACVKECPVEAISYKYGFAEKSKKKKETN